MMVLKSGVQHLERGYWRRFLIPTKWGAITRCVWPRQTHHIHFPVYDVDGGFPEPASHMPIVRLNA
jgi:hypothetical protein